MDHLFYMGEALQEAKKAYALGEVPVGAVVVHNNKIIARGHNLREKLHDATAHAEMIAIEKAGKFLGGWRLLNCSLYVTLEPCIMCAGAMIQARLPLLVFGARDEKGGGVGSVYDLVRDPRLNHQVQVVEGVLSCQSASLLKEFFKNRR